MALIFKKMLFNVLLWLDYLMRPRVGEGWGNGTWSKKSNNNVLYLKRLLLFFNSKTSVKSSKLFDICFIF